MEYKFKKGDRVVAVKNCSLGEFKKGMIGTCADSHDVPDVIWDNGEKSIADDSEIVLISELESLYNAVKEAKK